jgi:hypothetical protein
MIDSAVQQRCSKKCAGTGNSLAIYLGGFAVRFISILFCCHQGKSNGLCFIFESFWEETELHRKLRELKGVKGIYQYSSF